MTEQKLKDTIASIKALDQVCMDKCQLRLDNLIKPIGSLHSFEHIAVKMAGITKNPRIGELKKSLIIMAADSNEEEANPLHISKSAKLALNIANGQSPINTFARHADAKIILADIGLQDDIAELTNPDSFCSFLNIKIHPANSNRLCQSAMKREDTLLAIKLGIDIAEKEVKNGVNLVALGAINANAKLSSIAMVATYSHCNVKELLSFGNDLAKDTLTEKIDIIEKILAVNTPDKNDPLDVLSKLGSLEIAGLVGVILGASAQRAAVVIDGAESSVAALLAIKLAPLSASFLLGSHYPSEPCHEVALKIAGIQSYLKLNLKLGQGSGALFGMSLVKAAHHILNDMKTFGEADVAIAQDGPGVLRQTKDFLDPYYKILYITTLKEEVCHGLY